MKKHLLTGALAACVLVVGLSACSSTAEDMKPESTMPESQMSDSQVQDSGDSMASMMKSGMFEGMNDKMVSGAAELSADELKLTGFSSDEGPDLHVYLTNGTDEAAVSAGMMIDKVAFDQADQSFSLMSIDTSMYTDVVIHCDKAKAVFGAAKLS